MRPVIRPSSLLYLICSACRTVRQLPLMCFTIAIADLDLDPHALKAPHSNSSISLLYNETLSVQLRACPLKVHPRAVASQKCELQATARSHTLDLLDSLLSNYTFVLWHMKAVVIRRFGPPSVLEVESDFPKPTRRRTELLVRVICASVNPVDWKTRKGIVSRFLVTLPKV